MEICERKDECNGSYNCPATEHIEGCFATKYGGYAAPLDLIDDLPSTDRGAVDPSEVERLANDLAGDWRERAEKAEAEVTVWKTRLVEETARLRALLAAERGAV